jgi:hypothetical protein
MVSRGGVNERAQQPKHRSKFPSLGNGRPPAHGTSVLHTGNATLGPLRMSA